MSASMIRGLTRAGVGNVGSLKDLVNLASRHGFGAVDASGTELAAWIQADGLEAVKQHLRDKAVVMGCFSLPVDWSHTEAMFRDTLEALHHDAALAASVGCQRMMTWAMPSTPEPAVRYTAVTIRRLRLVARILAGWDLRLGIEYIGPHHLRHRESHPFLWDLPSALDWLDAIGEPNAGVVLDTFHWYTSAGTVDELRALDPARIVHVHLNDARPGPVEAVLDNDRLGPGEGVIPVVDFLRALASTGYRGIVAQEVLTPQPLTDAPEALALRSDQNFRRLFSAAGIELGT